ncbi:hypothetical protein ECPA34_3267, partial [Escherichia coli PA34]
VNTPRTLSDCVQVP